MLSVDLSKIEVFIVLAFCTLNFEGLVFKF